MQHGDLVMGGTPGNLLPGNFMVTLQEHQASSQHQDSGCIWNLVGVWLGLGRGLGSGDGQGLVSGLVVVRVGLGWGQAWVRVALV